MPARRYRKTAVTRERLIQAAEELFAERGYVGTTVDAIVERAQSSKGSFYHHYPSKEDLFLDFLRQRWQAQQQLLMAHLFAQSGPMTLRELAARGLALLEDPEHHKIWAPVYSEFWIMANRNPEVRARLGPMLAEWRQFLAQLVSGLQQAGLVDPVLEPAQAAGFVMICHYGILLQSLLAPDLTGPGQVAAFVERALEQGAGGGPGGGGPG